MILLATFNDQLLPIIIWNCLRVKPSTLWYASLGSYSPVAMQKANPDGGDGGDGGGGGGEGEVRMKRR